MQSGFFPFPIMQPTQFGDWLNKPVNANHPIGLIFGQTLKSGIAAINWNGNAINKLAVITNQEDRR